MIARLTASWGSMKEFSHDKALNREHDQFLSVTVAVYLGGGLLFLLAVPRICASSVHSRVSRNSGGLSFSSGSSRCCIRLIAPNVGKAFSDSSDQWEQSLLRRRKDWEPLAARSNRGRHDRVLVTKIANGKERIAWRLGWCSVTNDPSYTSIGRR